MEQDRKAKDREPVGVSGEKPETRWVVELEFPAVEVRPGPAEGAVGAAMAAATEKIPNRNLYK